MAYENDNCVKVMAGSGFQAPVNRSYSGDIFGILVSVGLIFGGASGRMVLRGTDSSPALVVAGILFLIWDIVSIVRKRSAIEKAEAAEYERTSKMYDREKVAARDDRALAGSASVRVACDKRLAALDFGVRLNGSAMTHDIKAQEYTGSTGRVRNIVSFNNLDLTAVFDIDDSCASEITIELFRDKAGIGIALPDGVTLVNEE